METSAKQPQETVLSKYNNLIQINAESIGIKSLNNEIMDFLNIEIEHKLKQILNQSKKFMRVSKRKTLKSDDINNSLRLLNFNVIQLTQPVIGYDAYANLEYEKIENVNGLWRQKQIIVDIEDYISKPIVSCPMSIFPHFHWLVLEGKRPNITENFIKEPSSERFRIDNPIEAQQTIELNDDQIEDIGTPNMSNRRHYRLNSINTLNNFNQNSNENKPERHGVQQAIIHNISKELQIFLDNFELRFRKEIKFSSKPYSIRSVTKEMQISLNIIKSEPGVVELLPYIIEFLMRSMSNKQFLNEPKVLMIVIRTLQGILDSPYFNLDPYLHQIVTIVLSIILSYNDKFIFDVVIAIKEQAIKVMQVIFLRYEIKYPKFVSQLLNLLRSHIIPNKDLKLMTVYGAIKALCLLGPEYILAYVYPELETIVNKLTSQTVGAATGFKARNNLKSERLSIDESQMKIEPVKLSEYERLGGNRTFQNNQTFENKGLSFSHNFTMNSSVLPNLNLTQETTIERKESIVSQDLGRGNLDCIGNSANGNTFILAALRDSLMLLVNYLSHWHSEDSRLKEIWSNVMDYFGEEILPSISASSGNKELEIMI